MVRSRAEEECKTLGEAYDEGYQQGRADKYQEITTEYMLLTEKQVEDIRADAIEEYKHNLKETFNNEFPINYHSTQPYFTLDNVRVLADAVAREMKEQKE